MQVLIVGAGPVGLTMAMELARFGVGVRIVDKAPQASRTSKALVVWSRTMELLDRSGCGAAFLAAGTKARAMRIVAAGRQIAHVGFAGIVSPHPYGLMIPQSETERLLAERLDALGVTVERGVEMTGFQAGGAAIAVTLRRADGGEERIEVPWLIGCDGAHSNVRAGLGLAFGGETLMTDWILGDVHLAGLDLPPDELAMYWHEDGVLALFPITTGRYRVIADTGPAKGEAHRPDPDLAEIQAMMDRRGPGGVRVGDPVWLSAFRINERKVKDYRVGRVFLAGDAAHIHSPAGGQGMNTGMQDTFNLAWKLALVCRGSCAAAPLLDSYSPERSAVGDMVLRNAALLTEVAIVRNPAMQAVRNLVAGLVLGLGPVRHDMVDTLSEVTIGYANSPLNGPGALFVGGPGPGERMAPCPDEAPVGAGPEPRFALFAADPEAAAGLAPRFPALLDSAPRRPPSERGLWLVRPDGYVAMTARAGETGAVSTYLERLAATG